MNKDNFVFLDPKGKRWPRFQLALFIGAMVIFLGLVIFIRSLMVFPRLHQLHAVQEISKTFRVLIKNEEGVRPSKLPPPWFMADQGKEGKTRPDPGAFKDDSNPVRMGFYVNWDPNSMNVLKRHPNQLTHICPEWFMLAGTPPQLKKEPDPAVREFAKEEGIALMPLLTNLISDRWQPEAVEILARGNQDMQAEFIAGLVAELKAIEAHGVVIDWEHVDPTYRDQVTSLLANLRSFLNEEGLELWLCVPMGTDIKVYDLDSLSPVVDRFVAMLYDENSESDPPGPMASQVWFNEWLTALMKHGAPEQWVVGIGNYGYDWSDTGEAESISFADSMARANSAAGVRIENGPPFPGPHFAYTENGAAHSVWFLDAITFHNQRKAAETRGAGGIAIYRLGTEDPQVWTDLDCVDPCVPESLAEIIPDGVISHVGKGDFITINNETAVGRRSVIQDKQGLFVTNYLRCPKYPLIFHQGENAKNQVAITFDDGPDPEWTPKILDILKTRDVKATFFIVGDNAANHPELVRRIVNEGHEIGNHTYSHANLGEISEPRVLLELNATQRLIENITGYSTLLFRPPYNADRRPQSRQEIDPLLKAQELGYVTVSASIDPEDWKQPDVETIVSRVKEHRNEGNIVLLHDAGGDRSHTVAALPIIIDHLLMRGDRIVPIHELINTSRQSLMPPIPTDEPAQSRFVAQTGLRLMNLAEEFIWAFMIVTTALVFLRTLIIIILAVIQRRRDSPASEVMSAPVSVLIAAYNEAKVIAGTIKSVLDTSYPGGLELIVVDDGSIDETTAIIAGIASQDKRVRLIRQPNQGKATSLNTAINASTHEFIVTLDADTHFQENTIGRLLAQFKDPQVGAVSGHAKVGNTGNWLARFQGLEYTCGFNLDRRAYDLWDCITVVPGAVSAFSRKAITTVGGISTDTLAEDTDLTLALHRAGYRVRYASGAVAWTEAPETVSSLVRQRTRWAFGTLQCLWKYKELIFAPHYRALAFFSLPGIWFFHLFLVAIIPLVDLALILSLLTGAGAAIIEYALVFLLLDFLLAIAACWMEKEPIRAAWLVLPMRFIYRPVLSIAVWRSLLRALRGVWVGWGKQDRKGIFRICQDTFTR